MLFKLHSVKRHILLWLPAYGRKENRDRHDSEHNTGETVTCRRYPTKWGFGEKNNGRQQNAQNDYNKVRIIADNKPNLKLKNYEVLYPFVKTEIQRKYLLFVLFSFVESGGNSRRIQF